MRLKVSESVAKDHADIEDLLWRVAVYCKEEDPDITLMGLHVQVRKNARPTYWSGMAYPHEHTVSYRTHPSTIVTHPAGRITMNIGSSNSTRDITTLFSHELRHIGQFHRGRKCHGFLTCDPMDPDEIEPDCYEFEELIIAKMQLALPKRYSGHSTFDEIYS